MQIENGGWEPVWGGAAQPPGKETRSELQERALIQLSGYSIIRDVLKANPDGDSTRTSVAVAVSRAVSVSTIGIPAAVSINRAVISNGCAVTAIIRRTVHAMNARRSITVMAVLNSMLMNSVVSRVVALAFNTYRTKECQYKHSDQRKNKSSHGDAPKNQSGVT